MSVSSKRSGSPGLNEPWSPILEEETATVEPALLSEAALAEDWRRDEEEQAWRHLQQEP